MPQENELGQEKTESPTQKRRTKSREKGSVAKSKEVSSALMLFFAVAVLALYGSTLIGHLSGFMRTMFLRFPEIEITEASFQAFAITQMWFFVKLVIPIFLVFLIVGVLSNTIQFGWLFTNQTIFQGMKNFSLSPMKVIKKIFAVGNLMTTGLNILKLIVLIAVAYHTLKSEIPKFPQLITLPLTESLRYTAVMLFKLSMKIIALLLIIAIIDFIFQKYKHEKTLKMSKQEVQDEMKMVEGDPKIRARIKSAQQKMVVSTMIKNVPEADVVITNPFHIAVAIKYDPKKMDAPMVVAKGARLIAERIKKAAREVSIAIVENKSLARTIYKTIDVGAEMPPKLYQAIAEVLAYVYQLDKNKARQFSRA